MKSFTSLAVAALLALPSALAAGGFTCQSAPEGNKLAYCVYDPVDNAPDGGWPTIISLPGSGARGPASNAKSLAGYDAVGKLLAHYISGENKDEVHTMAATKFLTIIPVAPEGSRHFHPEDVLQILNEVKKKYKVDEDKVYCTGFSMGSRGSFRFAVNHPEVLAAVAPSAGGAERPGDGTLSQEPADAVSPMLKNMVNLPLRQFAGKYDTTAGTDSPKKTQEDLEGLGAKDATLTIMDTDHNGLSTKPWTDTDLLSWFLKQSRSNSSSGSSPSATESSSENATTTYTPVSPPKSTGEAEDEECEDEDEGTSDEEENDCEDDDEQVDTPAGADGEDDCEDEEYDDEEDEDCGPEDDEDESSSASSGSYGSSDSKDSGNSYVDTSSGSDQSKDSSYSDTKESSSSSGERTYAQYNKSLAQEASTDESSSQQASADDSTSGSLEAEVVQPSRRARRGVAANHSAPIRARQHHAHGSSRMVHRRRAVRFGKAGPHAR